MPRNIVQLNEKGITQQFFQHSHSTAYILHVQQSYIFSQKFCFLLYDGWEINESGAAWPKFLTLVFLARAVGGGLKKTDALQILHTVLVHLEIATTKIKTFTNTALKTAT